VKDVTLPNGYIVKDVPNNYMVISTSELSFYKYERAIVSAMIKMFKRKQADPTFYSQRLFGAYAASNPTIPTAFHIVPYLPFGEENKQKHPVPKLAPRTITGRPFDAMTFTQKKNLLMADKECQYRMEYSKENDFREDVDMQKFDTKTFTPLNLNVVFEFPGFTK
jgi:hypothetical protein